MKEGARSLAAGCIAPFALSDEVTNTIPQETLGAMITCDFDAITARFEEFYQARGRQLPPLRPLQLALKRAKDVHDVPYSVSTP